MLERNKLWVLAVAFLAFEILVPLGAKVANAQQLPPAVKISGQYGSFGYCQITSLSSATLLSAALSSASCNPIPTCSVTPGQCPVFAEICSEGTAARYRDDGTAPTGSVGMPIATGTATAPSCFQYAGPLAQMQLITQSSGSILDITFYQ